MKMGLHVKEERNFQLKICACTNCMIGCLERVRVSDREEKTKGEKRIRQNWERVCWTKKIDTDYFYSNGITNWNEFWSPS